MQLLLYIKVLNKLQGLAVFIYTLFEPIIYEPTWKILQLEIFAMRFFRDYNVVEKGMQRGH
jgi:hypothetical protein